jgi:hypothetical protein
MMPGSMPEGKELTRQFLLDKPVKRVLDIGPGSGNYFDLLNCHGEYHGWGEPNKYLDVYWLAVEIYEPYINRFNLRAKYDSIIIADAYDIDWNDLGQFDVIFLGDVLEHMVEERGREVIRQSVDHSKWVVISLPIIDYPQGCEYGNIHETHVEQYSPQRMKELLKDYNIITSMEGKVIGVYILEGWQSGNAPALNTG